jgi:multiple sugar transport system permease protein
MTIAGAPLRARRRSPATGRVAGEDSLGQVARQGVAMLVIIAFELIPLLWIVSLSLKTPGSLTDGSFLPQHFTWSNYSAIFHQSLFTRPLINSIGIAAIATMIAVVLATMAAYAIARLRFRGKQIIIGGALVVAMFPQISLVTPLFNLWRSLGLFNTWLGLIIPYLTFSLPLAIYVLSAFFREIPWELEQASAIDGATPFQTFRLVLAPLAAPAVFTTAILVFMFCWNDFLFSFSLTSTTAARTVPATLAFFSGASQFQDPYGTIAAAAVVVTIPVVIMVLVFQRRIVSGLTSGAVKG